jgi:hypothetical protein
MLNPRWPDPAGFPNLGKTGRYFSKDWKWRFFMAKKKAAAKNNKSFEEALRGRRTPLISVLRPLSQPFVHL